MKYVYVIINMQFLVECIFKIFKLEEAEILGAFVRRWTLLFYYFQLSFFFALGVW